MSEAQGRGRGRGRGNRPPTAEGGEAAPKEEKKEGGRGRGGRPKTEGGETSERRGNGRGRGGDRDNNDREHGGRGRGGQGRGGQKRDNGDGKPRQQNEDQWIYKFHKESLRKTHDYKVDITNDMEIPEVPDKSSRLAAPEKAKLTATLDELEGKFKALNEKKKKKIDDRKNIMSGPRLAGSNSTARDELNRLISEQKVINKEKSALTSQMRGYKEQIEGAMVRSRTLKKMMLPGYESLEEIQDALAHKKHRQTTCSMSGQEEAVLIKEITKLEGSVKFATELEPITPMIKEVNGKKKELFGQLDALRDSSTSKQKEIDAIKASLDEQKGEANEKKDALDKTSEELDELSKQMNEIFEQKDAAKDTFWKEMFDHREQQDLIAYADWIKEQVSYIKEHEKEKQSRISELKAAVTTIDNPKKGEIKTCQYLIGVCNTLKKRSGLVEDVEQQAREAQQAADKERMQERMDKMMQEGKIENGRSKQEIENEGMICIGKKSGGKKNKGKKTQVQTAKKVEDQYEDPFQHDITLIQKFSMVNISPPNLPQDLDDCIDRLTSRQDELAKEGETAQKEAMEARMKETEQEIAALEKQTPAQVERPMGRGGRGRGNTRGNDNRGGRTGRGGRGGRREEQVEERENTHTHKDNAEFEDSDDDKKYYQAPARATAGNKKDNTKKQGSLKMDEDNFPSF